MGLGVGGVRVDPRQPLDSLPFQDVVCIIRRTCVAVGYG